MKIKRHEKFIFVKIKSRLLANINIKSKGLCQIKNINKDLGHLFEAINVVKSSNQ